MRSFRIILLLGIFLFVVITVFTTQSAEDPADEARVFLAKVASNDVAGALREFGDNTCHCAPKGGYEAYLQYEKCNDPNIAFMLGQPFSLGKSTAVKAPSSNEINVLPWEKPEDYIVYIPVSFDDERHRPYFIPLDMAFGYDTSAGDLEKFSQDPPKDWMKGFTLRLRPTLEMGFIKVPAPRAKKGKGEDTIDEALLPPEVLRYFHPKDPGSVKLASGGQALATQYASQLPRLKSIVIGMKVVRRGLLSRWAVKKIGVQDAVIISGGHEFKLSESKSQAALHS